MSTKAPGEILELFRGGYLSIAETIDALDTVEGYVSVELLNIERAISDDLREQNAKLREAAATPAVGGEPRKWIIDLIHNEYDPKPSNYRIGDNWNDGAEEIADQILERLRNV